MPIIADQSDVTGVYVRKSGVDKIVWDGTEREAVGCYQRRSEDKVILEQLPPPPVVVNLNIQSQTTKTHYEFGTNTGGWVTGTTRETVIEEGTRFRVYYNRNNDTADITLSSSITADELYNGILYTINGLTTPNIVVYFNQIGTSLVWGVGAATGGLGYTNRVTIRARLL